MTGKHGVRIGVTPFGGESRVAPANVVDVAVERARQAQELGIHGFWFSSRFEYDSIGLAGHVGRAVPDFGVGTAVVPIPGLHPLLVSGQAQTAQAAARGQFTLGLGLGVDAGSRAAMNLPNNRPAQRMRDFLSALRPALHEGAVDSHGEFLTAVAPHTAVPGAQPPPPILLAAMGPLALTLAGELAEGTIAFLATPEVIAEHIAPVITAAAEAAGRPRPRVLAMMSAVVTDDTAAAEAAFEEEFGLYDHMPSYIRIVSLGGKSRAAQMGVYGDEETVASAIRGYVDAGVDEIIVSRTNLLGDATQERTWQLVGELAREYEPATASV